MTSLLSLIDFTSPRLYLAFAHIFFNPFLWNIISRLEYYKKFVSKIFGSRLIAVYVWSAIVFTLGISRNLLFKFVVDEQKKLDLPNTYIDVIGYSSYTIGIILVVSSSIRLGIVGTYNGDAFGFLFPSKITGFPFNVTSSPMYDGSTLNFLGHAILYRSPVGVILSIWVYIVYRVSCCFEE
jgi:methylene-fatty-acyl-phospholipid synthase